MRLIESTHADGQEKRELPPPFRNPFVHDLRFTTAQKLQVRVASVCHSVCCVCLSLIHSSFLVCSVCYLF
uniref:Uncharacterized protein n=1 Tax=Sinocyclocheilus rhinocerous TaxID=307959 RepID=A0A673IM62_9TELE